MYKVIRSNHALYHGDCLEVMDQLVEEGVKVDAIITDPPFGTTKCKWDSVIPLDEMWKRLQKLKRSDRTPVILFAQTPFDKVLGCSNLSELKYEWIWEKTQATGHLNAKKMPMKAHENILVFYKKLPVYNPQMTDGHKPVNSYTKTIKMQNKTQLYGDATQELTGGGSTVRYPRSVQVFASDKQRLDLHSTQKPQDLIEYLVKTYTNEGDLVLDFTMGSGRTNIACERLGRKSIGIDNGYCSKEKHSEYYGKQWNVMECILLIVKACCKLNDKYPNFSETLIKTMYRDYGLKREE